MPAGRPALGIRLQLLGLFGLMLLAGAAVLVVDESERWRNRTALAALKDESLAGLRRVKAVSDAYGLDIVDSAVRVHSGAMSWESGIIQVDTARLRIDEHWAALAALPRSEDEESLFRQIVQARRLADRATAELREILARRDRAALAVFVDAEMYPAVDPVIGRLKRLSDLSMISAERAVQRAEAAAQRAAWLRTGISLLALVVIVLVGRVLLRNIYKGVENLTWLAQRMREKDYAAQPRYQPSGELGEVMDSFLRMRDDVRGYAEELTGQLARNEATRAALQARELFQQSLLSAAQVAILSLDREGRFTSVNPYAERLCGYRADELVGLLGLDHLLDRGELRRVAAAMSAALEREVPADAGLLAVLVEQGTPPLEWSLQGKGGRRVPVLLATSALRDEAGERVGYLCVGTDLAQIKALEKQLRASEARAREASEAKSAFLAAMSHEIRTPMIGVTGMLEVLSHSPLDPEQRRTVQVIQQSAQALLQIIGDILDFSKVEAGRMELAPSTVSLPRLLRATAANYTGSASSKGLVLRCTIDERVGPAHLVDGLRLRQVLSNFLSNAIKFTEAGEVELKLEWLGAVDHADRFCFSVRDTGIGVTPEQQARLFQPFTQAEGTTTRRFGGTGLGLAIARRLTELMGGRLEMDSEAGRGTTLRLWLTLPRGRVEELEPEPLAEAPQDFPARPLPSVAAAEAERSLVLIVDDHPTNRQVVGRQLALAGYASETADDGREGLERWRSGRYALVLSDVHMPHMDGYEFARELRRVEREEGRRHTPVVALTAAALKGEAERCLAAGMDDYLAKPVSIAQLVATLQRWLPHTRRAAGAATATPLPQAETPPLPLSHDVLREIAGDDPASWRALLDDFLASTRGDLSSVQAAREAGDVAQLAREAHKIKGAARLIGAEELARAAEAVEQHAKVEDWPQILPLLADLHTAAERLRHYVEGSLPG